MSEEKNQYKSFLDHLKELLNLIKTSQLLYQIKKLPWFPIAIGIISAFILWGCIHFEEDFNWSLNQLSQQSLEK